MTLRLLLVAAVVAATAATAEYFLRKNLSHEDVVNVMKYDAVFRDDSGADIFILGNSQSAYGIMPSLLEIPGHKVHNYSFPGACASYNRDLYRRYLARYRKRPRLVVYAVSWFMFDAKVPPRKVAQDYQFVPLDVDPFTIPPHERLFLIHQMDVLSKMFKRPRDNNILVDKYDNGFVPLDGTYGDVGTKTEPRVVNSRNEISNLVELIESIRADGIALLFVETPEYTRGVRCESIVPNEELLGSIARRYRVEYLNYNRERRSAINDDPSCFGEWQHLNYAGARRFSAMLSKDLNDLIRERKLPLE